MMARKRTKKTTTQKKMKQLKKQNTSLKESFIEMCIYFSFGGGVQFDVYVHQYSALSIIMESFEAICKIKIYFRHFIGRHFRNNVPGLYEHKHAMVL